MLEDDLMVVDRPASPLTHGRHIYRDVREKVGEVEGASAAAMSVMSANPPCVPVGRRPSHVPGRHVLDPFPLCYALCCRSEYSCIDIRHKSVLLRGPYRMD